VETATMPETMTAARATSIFSSPLWRLCWSEALLEHLIEPP